MGPHGYLQVLILCSTYIQSGTSIHDASSLVLGVIHVMDRSVTLRWEGMPMDRVMDCVLNFSVNHTDIWTILDYTPMNFSFCVPDLQPATYYKFILVCHDNTNGKHTSPPVNFTTAYEGSTVGYGEHTMHQAPGSSPPPAATPTVISRSERPQPRLSTLPATPTAPPAIPSTQASRRPTPPAPVTSLPVATKRTTTTSRPKPRRPSLAPGGFGGAVIETATSPMDIGLGVAFGFIGCGVFAMMAYFCIKEYRRRLRIRRFLQYRRQENEPFPDMDNDDDEGIVP